MPQQNKERTPSSEAEQALPVNPATEYTLADWARETGRKINPKHAAIHIS